MNDKEGRLPKWAQDELNLLRRNLKDARQDILKLTTGVNLPATNFRINPDMGRGEWVPSFHARVRLYIGPTERDWIELHHEAQRDGTNPCLMLYGERQLSLQPRVSNTTRVFLSDR